jgi:hypothetical protein
VRRQIEAAAALWIFVILFALAEANLPLALASGADKKKNLASAQSNEESNLLLA